MPQDLDSNTIINIDQPLVNNPQAQDDQPSDNAIFQDLAISFGASTAVTSGVIAITQLLKNLNDLGNSRRSDGDSSADPNLNYLILIIPISALIGMSIMSIRKCFHEDNIADIRQKINALCDITSDEERTANIDKLSEICEDINEKKLGNYLFTTLVNSLMRIAPENLDFVNDCLDIAIPRIHQIEISNLNPRDHRSLRRELLKLTLARDSNFDQSRYSPESQELLLKAQSLFANKSNTEFINSIIDSYDRDNFSTKDLFLIYALSNSKSYIRSFSLSRLFHDADCRDALIQLISNGVSLYSNRRMRLETIESHLNADSNVPIQISAQLTGSEARPEILSRLFVIGDQNQEINSQSNAGASDQSDRAIVQSSVPPQRVIFVNLYQVNSSSNDSNRGLIPI
jgi:hypothetical protein